MVSIACQCGHRVEGMQLSLVLPQAREMQVREAQIPSKLDSGTIGSLVQLLQLSKFTVQSSNDVRME